MSEFSRNVQVEEAAVKELGYTADQVKRRTIAQLTKELDEERQDVKDISSPREKHGRDDHDKRCGERDRSTSTTISKGSSSRRNDSSTGNKKEKRVTFDRKSFDRHLAESAQTADEDPLGRIYVLEATIEAKRAFTDTLEQDPDFTTSDLFDWHESIEILQEQLDNYRKHYQIELQQLWERRQTKLKAMEQRGLLEPSSLAKKWAEKQQVLKSQSVFNDQEVQSPLACASMGTRART